MIKKVLITGATGYLGSHLAKKLVSLGYEVVALKRKSSSISRIQSIAMDLKLVDADEIDFDILFKRHQNIDAIIHTATSYGRGHEALDDIFNANTVIPLRLLDAGSRAGVAVFINSDTALNKYLNIYSMSKNQLLQWGKFFSKQKKIQFINLRLEHFYGPGDSSNKFAAHVIKSCIDNSPELRLTLGEQKRDFIYIDDVVSAYTLILNKSNNFKNKFIEFDVGSGHSISIKEFVNLVHLLSKSNTRLLFGAMPYRNDEVMYSMANIEPLKRLGWVCRTNLMDGLKYIIDHCKI